MAYDKNKIFKQAKEAIVKHKLFFIEDIVAFLPCDKTTFYRFFEVQSNEYNTLKELLESNKVKVKAGLRGRWYKGGNSTTEIALYKLCATKEELEILSNAQKTGEDYQKITIQIESDKAKLISDNDRDDTDNEFKF